MNKSIVLSLVILLLSCHALQTVLSMQKKAPTADELSFHVASGYSYLVTGAFKLNPASPPLPRMLSALPLIAFKPNMPFDHPSWANGDTQVFSNQFFYHYNNRADDYIFWARLPIVILSLFFGLALFYWTQRLFNPLAGLFALTLFTFCPDILAHSRLATADLSVALFFFLSVMSFGAYLNAPTRPKMIITGIFAGLTFLSKFTAIFLFPILLLIGILSKKTKLVSLPKTVSYLIICFLTVWAGYLFEIKPLLKDTPNPENKIAFIEKVAGPKVLKIAQEVPLPLSTFVSAISSMVVTRAKGTNTYFKGEWSAGGWWYYYFVAFLIKNTIPFILLTILALLFMTRLNLGRTYKVTLLTPIVFFFVATMGDKAQAGIRYFLPIYPLFMILIGGFMAQVWRKHKGIKIVFALLLFWHAAEALMIFPHHLSYFNEAIGGPSQGYKYLRDSNLDWGQDLKGLSHYLKANNLPEVTLHYPWPADPNYYSIRYKEFTKDEFKKPKNKIYVIAGHFLDSAEWTHVRKPTKVIGHTMFVYDFRNGNDE